MSWMQGIGLILAVLIGGGLSFYFQRLKSTFIPKIVLAFGGAYLLGLAFVELLPSVYFETSRKIGIWILVGFMIQLLLELFSKGVEHGHMHLHKHSTRYFASVMVGLCIHALLEGLPMQEGGFVQGHQHQHAYFWGIVIHKLPAAFALASVLIGSGVKKMMVITCLLIFSIMTPLGAWMASYYIFETSDQQIILAIVIGLFLHIATTILFEVDQSASHHTVSWYKLVAIVMGFVAVLLV